MHTRIRVREMLPERQGRRGSANVCFMHDRRVKCGRAAGAGKTNPTEDTGGVRENVSRARQRKRESARAIEESSGQVRRKWAEAISVARSRRRAAMHRLGSSTCE